MKDVSFLRQTGIEGTHFLNFKRTATENKDDQETEPPYIIGAITSKIINGQQY